MTPKQVERTQKKIKAIRAGLAAERRKFGCYDDSRGTRYLPPALYIKIADYKGGLTYFRWFARNFPDDVGFPDFLFEWTYILFQNGKLKDSQSMAKRTYFSNTHWIPEFLGLPPDQRPKEEWSSTEQAGFLQYQNYSRDDAQWRDFADWLEGFYAEDTFIEIRERYIQLQKQLLDNQDSERRLELLQEVRDLKKENT